MREESPTAIDQAAAATATDQAAAAIATDQHYGSDLRGKEQQ